MMIGTPDVRGSARIERHTSSPLRPRQHQIQHDQRRRPLTNDRHDLGAGGQDFGRVTRLVEMVRHQFRYVLIVLDDQHAIPPGRRVSGSASSGSGAGGYGGEWFSAQWISSPPVHDAGCRSRTP